MQPLKTHINRCIMGTYMSVRKHYDACPQLLPNPIDIDRFGISVYSSSITSLADSVET